MKRIVNQIPNMVSIAQVPLGLLATYNIVLGNRNLACFFLGIGILCDFFDGAIARVLKAESKFGKEILESVTDCFLVFPPLIGFVLRGFPIIYPLLLAVVSLMLLFISIDTLKTNQKIRALSGILLVGGYVVSVMTIFIYLLPSYGQIITLISLPFLAFIKKRRIQSLFKEFIVKWQEV